MVHPILVKSTSHSALHSVTTLIREYDAKPGMMWARPVVTGRPGRSNVLVCVDRTCSPLGRRVTIGFWAGLDVGDVGTGSEEIACCAGSKMAQLFMVSMSMLTGQRSMAVASTYGWVGVGQVCNIVFRFILLLSAAPACQKLLYHS